MKSLVICALLFSGFVLTSEAQETPTSLFDPAEKVDIRPLVPWMTTPKPPMHVKAALTPATPAVRESIHPEASKFEWIATERLASPPEAIVGLLLGQTFLVSENIDLELTSFEVGITKEAVSSTPAMRESEQRSARAIPPIIGLVAVLASSGAGAHDFTVAMRVAIKVNGELFILQKAGPFPMKKASDAVSGFVASHSTLLATCIEAYAWRQRKQDVQSDTWASCHR